MRDLYQKYDKAGPRYTSYPPVPFWQGPPSELDWMEHIKKHFNPKQGVDLYIHIPYCQTLCWYCGCFRTISKDLDKGDVYTEYLLKEWDHYIKAIPEIRLHSLHFGGGTPTFLKPQTLKKLLATLAPYQNENFLGSIEVDPRTCELEHLEVLSEFGVKRISMGIQDFDPEVQAAINRHQSFDMVKHLVGQIRERKFNSVNFDLIYGLPKQNTRTIRSTIEKVIELQPDLIAFYSYAHLPDKLKNQRLIKDEDLPSGVEKRELYELGRELLFSQGYVEVGLDHFARKDSYLGQAAIEKRLKRNFMGYTDEKTPNLIALGVSSISNSPESFVQNEKDIKRYFEFLDEGKLPITKGHIMSDHDKLIDEIIHELMCNKQLSVSQLDGHPHYDAVMEELQSMEQDGLLDFNNDMIVLTPSGQPFLRNVAMVFDQYLKKQTSDTPRFSRTI
jgi:oxygen-independent coproporphyrinogen-3 oxidase